MALSQTMVGITKARWNIVARTHTKSTREESPEPVLLVPGQERARYLRMRHLSLRKKDMNSSPRGLQQWYSKIRCWKRHLHYNQNLSMLLQRRLANSMRKFLRTNFPCHTDMVRFPALRTMVGQLELQREALPPRDSQRLENLPCQYPIEHHPSMSNLANLSF